jgi:hypothetical protein
MEPNQTSFIVLNATLNRAPQPSWTLLISPASILISALIGVFASLFGVHKKEQYDWGKTKLQRQEQAYSQLKGFKYIISQLELSICDAFSSFEWIVALERLQLPPLPELGGLDERHREYKELILELARYNQRLWETIGLIQILFSPSEELNKFIDPFESSILKLRDYRVEKIAEYYEKTTKENVNVKPYVATEGVDEVVRKYVEIPFEALQKYLEDEIKAERIRIQTKYWWQFWR